MTKKFLFTLFSVALIVSGCTHHTPAEDTAEDMVLDFQLLSFLGNSFVEGEILSGNGGYRVVYPKRILYFDENWQGGVVTDDYFVDYSEDYLRLAVVERDARSFVRVERVLPIDQDVEGYFLVIDNKGKKRLFEVSETTLRDINDLRDEFEEQMCNDPDYWLNE